MSTVASALAGALASGSVQGTVAGAQAGKNATENNALGPDELPFGDEEKEHERQVGDEPVKVVPLNPGTEPIRDENGHPLTYAPGTGVPIYNEKINTNEPTVVIINKSKYPESAKHIEDAQKAGYPNQLTIDRAGAVQRRKDALKGTPVTSGMDRDEYPPAMFQEGGKGASVRPVTSSDNRGAGACIGIQCRGLPDGSTVTIKTDKEK
ncbi:hypothetical protein J3N71_004853 [Salmonella enterica subsp. enterica serovar Oranienburg]|nr:hypothetical protein [Salmonella enterica subsp. enterica serovar Oranienburg]